MNSVSFIENIKKNKFLFEELVARDFKEKYKRTVLGMGWSVLSPLLNLLILVVIFTKLLGRDTPHYTVYVFCGTLIMSYYKESTKGGMRSLMANRDIISKINIPKYMFLLSSNVSSFINFCLTLSVFVLLCIFDHISIGWRFLMLMFPILCMMLFNIGVGMVLSGSYVFFKDTGYLYDILLTILNYVSAVFYRIDSFSINMQRLFLCNPLYCFINYFREIVIYGNIPSFQYHLLCLFYGLASMAIGISFYNRYKNEFIYYM